MRSIITTSTTTEKPIVSFIFSLIAGILILGGSVTVMGFSFGDLTMWHDERILLRRDDGRYYGMMRGFGFGGGWFSGLAAIGIASGIIILIGAIMIYNQPARASTWGALILAFSIVSLFGMGGFFFGAVLGVVGGILALTWKK